MTLVALAGLPGTGKSMVARGLASHLTAVVLDKDPIRAALFGTSGVDYSRAQDDLCASIMLRVAGYMIRTARVPYVILDGRPHSRRYQVEVVDRYARCRDIRVALIECVCSPATALGRLQQDKKTATHEARNRDRELYERLRSEFQPIREPKLVVSTEGTVESIVRRCLEYLVLRSA